MKKTILFLLVVPFLFILSCSTSMEEVRFWLDDMKGEPIANIEGEWTSGEIGSGVLIQKGNRVTGSIGGCEVQGVVNGNKVYLLFGTYGTFYYAAELESYKSLLIGKYSYTEPRKDQLADDALPVTFIKVKDIK